MPDPTPKGAYVVVYEERSDDGPRLVGPFDSREAAWAYLDTAPPMAYSESHVEQLHAPAKADEEAS